MKFYTIYFLLSLFLISGVNAQTTKNPILNYKVRVANSIYEKQQYVKAEKKYGSLLEKDALNDDEIAQYAYVLFVLGKADSSLKVLSRVDELSDLGAQTSYDAYMMLGDYFIADSLLDLYPVINVSEVSRSEPIHVTLESLPNGEELLVTLMDFNSSSSDYAPVLNDDTLYFTSSRIGKSFWRGTYDRTGSFYQDIYRVDDNGVSPLAEGINTPYHDGPLCFSDDGNIMIVCRNNYSFSNYGNDKEEFNELHLYKSYKKSDGQWSDLELLPFCQEEYYYTHPFIKEGKLYFSSNVPGGYGLSDIYYVLMDDDGNVASDMVNMGEVINTRASEGFPFINKDGCFYFSSDGHFGFGGLDIFKYIKDGDSFVLRNLGKKFNTSFDDFSLIVKDDSNGYFASNRTGGKGDDDIYHYRILPKNTLRVIDASTEHTLQGVAFEMSKIPNSEPILGETDTNGVYDFYVDAEFDELHVTVPEMPDYYHFDTTVNLVGNTLTVPLVYRNVGLRGYVYDEKSGVRYGDVSIVITDEAGNSYKNITDINGDYSQQLERNQKYHVQVLKDSYIPIQDSLTTAGVTGWLEMNFPISNFISLEGVYYDLDKYNIRPDAAIVLDRVVKMLKNYPLLHIELSSHTDSRGTERYNDSLAQNRSNSAVRYIESQGIDSSRIVAKSYGESQLKNNCSDGVPCSSVDHQENRRTEIRIIN